MTALREVVAGAGACVELETVERELVVGHDVEGASKLVEYRWAVVVRGNDDVPGVKHGGGSV